MDANSSSTRMSALAVLAAIFIWRLIYAAIVPLDLVPDEAYYWHWSQQIDWGYYSKPPMIAWVIGLSTSLLGDSELGVRMPAVLLSSLGLWWVYLLGRSMYNERVGLFTMLLCLATPGAVVMGLLMTIDAPFLFFWTVSLYTVWRLLQEDKPTFRTWVFAVLTTGLGLLSKQTMVGIFPVVGCYLVTSWAIERLTQKPSANENLRKLISPRLWMWGLASLAFLTPVLIWNSQHDWITFQHTSSHFESQAVPVLKRLSFSFEFLLGQMGVGAPVTFIAFVIVSWRALLNWRELQPRERFLLSASTVPLAAILGLSFIQRVNPNWPAPFYIAGYVLTAAWFNGQFDPGFSSSWFPNMRARGFRRCVTWGLVAAAVVYAVPFAIGHLQLAGTKADPTPRLRGWSELAEKLEPHFESGMFVVASSNRNEASELAFYLPDHPPSYLWNPSDRVTSQYDIWGEPDGIAGHDGIIVSYANREIADALKEQFKSLAGPHRINIDLGHGRTRDFDIWIGRQFTTKEDQ